MKKKWPKSEWVKSEWVKSEWAKSEFPQISASSMELFFVLIFRCIVCYCCSKSVLKGAPGGSGVQASWARYLTFPSTPPVPHPLKTPFSSFTSWPVPPPTANFPLWPIPTPTRVNSPPLPKNFSLSFSFFLLIFSSSSLFVPFFLSFHQIQKGHHTHRYLGHSFLFVFLLCDLHHSCWKYLCWIIHSSVNRL